MDGPYVCACSGCEGTGRVLVGAWAHWLQTYRRIEFGVADPVARLAALVDHLQAQPDPAQITVQVCAQCGGGGCLLTDHGRQLVDFLRRHLPALIDHHLRKIQPGAAPPITVEHQSRPPRLRPV